mgnify:CR=1 FL=1
MLRKKKRISEEELLRDLEEKILDKRAKKIWNKLKEL